MFIDNETTIEFATAADVEEIGHLSKEYIEYDLGWKYTPNRLKVLLKDKTRNIIVARKDSVLIGFGIMTYQDERANLDLLAVKNDHRQKGIGRQIVAWLEKVALTGGTFNVLVQVRKINKGAIHFYTKLGYKVIDEKSGYYRGQETGVIMAKDLRAATSN